MTSKLSLNLDQLLKLIPPSTNPFKFISRYLYDKYFPELSSVCIRTLQVFFAFHLLICLSCLTILVLPFLRSQRSSHWLIKKLYITDPQNNKVSTRPLYLLNSGALMAISQLLASVSTEIYIGMYFRAWKHREYLAKAQLTTCLAAVYSFEFLAYWFMAWNSLYTRLSLGTAYPSRINSQNRSLIPPSVYNLIFISFPIVVMITHAYVVYGASKAFAEQSRAWFEMTGDLSLGSDIWEKLHQSSIDQKTHAGLLKEMMEITARLEGHGLSVIQKTGLIISKFRIQCIFWNSVMFITCMVFIYCTVQLLSVVYKKIDEASNPQSIPKAGASSQSRSEENNSDSPLAKAQFSKPQDQRSRMMRNRFHNLAFRSGGMALSIKSTIIACMLGTFHTEAVVTSPYWRSTMAWIALISGTLATLPITFQCWRIYRDEEDLNAKKSQTNGKQSILHLGYGDLSIETIAITHRESSFCANSPNTQDENEKGFLPGSNPAELNMTKDIPLRDLKRDCQS